MYFLNDIVLDLKCFNQKYLHIKSKKERPPINSTSSI